MPLVRRPIRFFALFVAFAGCAPLAVGGGSPSAPSAARPVSSVQVASASTDAGPNKRPMVVKAAPPPVVTTALPGEPTGAKLDQSRLSPSSCNDYKARRKAMADAAVAKMRQAVADSFREWHDAQPRCWAEDRERDAERRRLQDSFGAGVGQGMGLASVGGVAYGAGSSPGAGGRGGSVEARSASSYSRTNTQVASVDEADMVKTDGRYVYFAVNGALRIAEALNPRIVSVTKLPGTVRDLFVEGDRAVVYTSIGRPGPSCTYGYDCVFAGDGTGTRVTVLDVKDRASPKVVREIELTGSLVTSRRIGNAVHTVVVDGDLRVPSYASWPEDLETCGTKESVVRAKFEKLKSENETKIRQTLVLASVKERGVEKFLCDSLLRPAFDSGSAFTSVVSFDMTKDSDPVQSSSVESRPGAVFASSDTLYMAVTRTDVRSGSGRSVRSARGQAESSDIHAFHIGRNPAETKYEGSGLVPGHVLDSFAMDEWYGYLRVATSKGRVPDPNVESVLSVFAKAQDGNRVRVGAIDHIAPGEDIRSVRFDDDRGYVVTFKKTDPLFVMDLAAPDKPKILGELKIPGFSTYMHRIDPDHLLSIGFDAVDHDSFAYFDGVILQLFDVKNPTDPRLLHKEKLGTRGSSSEAATNHLAFNYFAEKGLLAVPMTVCEGGGDGVAGRNLTFSGLYVYDVDIERGFTRLGGIDHGTRGVGCATWWSNANSTVKRSVFLDDLVYSVATDRAKVQKLGRLGTDVASLSFVP